MITDRHVFTDNRPPFNHNMVADDRIVPDDRVFFYHDTFTDFYVFADTCGPIDHMHPPFHTFYPTYVEKSLNDNVTGSRMLSDRYKAKIVSNARFPSLAVIKYGRSLWIACKKSSYIATCSRSEEHTSELQSRFDLVCRL